jgi:hypothetical protein
VPAGSSEILAVHAALLYTGHILFFGGDENDSGRHEAMYVDHTVQPDTTRLYDCRSGAVTRIASPGSDVFCSGHALLSDGRLLVAGGAQNLDMGHFHTHATGLRDTWFFDPSRISGQPGSSPWRRTQPMNPMPGDVRIGICGGGSPPEPLDRLPGGGRWYPTLITMTTGAVLAMNGHPKQSDRRHNNHTPESYLPGPGTWHLQPAVGDPCEHSGQYPRLHVLPGGRVFSATPLVGAGRSAIYDPGTGTAAPVGGQIPQTNEHLPPDYWVVQDYYTTSVLLPLSHADGYRPRVLICGSDQAFTIDLGPGAANAGWQQTGPRSLGRRYNLNAVLLPTGEVFVCGGVAGDPANPEPALRFLDATGERARVAELYQPATRTWQELEAATVVRNYHSVALLMPDGRVWTAGSSKNHRQSFDDPPGVDNRELRIEVYEPWYVAEPRPRISFAPPALSYGAAFEVRTPDAASIRRVMLLRSGSVTHAFNSDQRCIELDFRPGAAEGVLAVTAPPDGGVAPPGFYLPFVLDAAGVPSEGRFVGLPALGWHAVDLTNQVALTGLQRVADPAGGPAAYVFDAQATQHVFYRDNTGGHVWELWWNAVEGWHGVDVSADAARHGPAPAPAGGDGPPPGRWTPGLCGRGRW